MTSRWSRPTRLEQHSRVPFRSPIEQRCRAAQKVSVEERQRVGVDDAARLPFINGPGETQPRGQRSPRSQLRTTALN